MTNTEILRGIVRANAFAKNERHSKNVSEAIRFYKAGKIKECGEALAKLPTDEQLLVELMEKLKGKSVHTNVKKLTEGKMTNKYAALKTYSSLLTHTAIEAEQGRTEYTLLFESILQKIYKLL